MNRMEYLRQHNVATAARRRSELLEEIFVGSQDRLLGMLYCLLGNREDAEKAFQEAFFKCWRRLDSAGDLEHLEAWVFRVALNVGRDLRGSVWRRRPLADDEAPIAADAPAADIIARVRRVLLTLGREEQEVFLLRQNGRLTYEQIAQAVNIPLGSVKTRMQLALSKLQPSLPTVSERPADRVEAAAEDVSPPGDHSQLPTDNAQTPPENEKPPATEGEGLAADREDSADVEEQPAAPAETGQRLLELTYDLLADDEAAGLRVKVAADGELARAQVAAQQTASLFAEAARLESPRIELRLPRNLAGSRPRPTATSEAARKAARTNGVALKPQVRRLTRGANWAVVAASFVLLFVSVGGFFYHRGQLADIAAENLRLLVIGPSRLRAGVHAECQEYTVITTTVTGTPVSAQVEFAFFPPVGERMGHLQRTDDQGRLRVTIPADRLRPGKARLEIRAQGQDHNQMERVETPVRIEPAQHVTHLSLDKPVYRPGEPVRYRSLTLSRFWLTAVDATPIQFDVVDSKGATLAGSLRQGTTRRGVGCGEFLLPSDLAEGTYALVAKSLDGTFPPHRKTFRVRADRPATAKQAAKKGTTKEGVTKETSKADTKRATPEDASRVEVAFFPEGGELTADLENRVYFSARDAQGRPVAVSGKVLDSGGRVVARLDTSFEGMGGLVLEPRVGELYRLKIEQPSGVNSEPRLPDVVAASQVVLTAGLGVFEPGKPLEFNVRATEAGIPLVATAWCRGVMVGEQALVTEAAANSVSIPLVDKPHSEVSGVVRLTIYDCRFSPPRRIAERLVYRKPARRLDVQIGPPKMECSPGQSVPLAVEVRDENGAPYPAPLSVEVVDQATSPPLRSVLGDSLETPEELENAGLCLSGDPKAAVALDLLLATRGWRRVGEKMPPDPRQGSGQGKAASPPDAFDTDAVLPVIFDNLPDLQARYQGSLASYRANRTRLLNTLTVVSFFGGGGLVLLVAMLSMLGITTGLRLWTTSLAVAATCLILGSRLMNPERLKSPSPSAATFARHHDSPDATAGKAASTPATAAKPSLKSLRPFPVEGLFQREKTAASPGRGDKDEDAVRWRPLSEANREGRAQIRVDLPAAPAVYRVVVDAYSEGYRLGTGAVEIVATKRPAGK